MSNLERVEIIKEIGDIFEEHCKLCPLSKEYWNRNRQCAGCPYYLRLRELGVRLENLSARRKNREPSKSESESMKVIKKGVGP